MFTGIVETRGRIASALRKGRHWRLAIEMPASMVSSLKKGASLSVNGACLTVVGKKGKTVDFDVVPETLRRTNLGRLMAGDRVNLERPLRYGRRVDGHFVLGHVDGRAKLQRAVSNKKETRFLVAAPAVTRRFILEKGSVTLDGVSLTVGKVSRKGFWVHVIPHTLNVTTLGSWKAGALINLETDLLAKLASRRAAPRGRFH